MRTDNRLSLADPVLCSTPVNPNNNAGNRKRSFFTDDPGSPFVATNSTAAESSSLDVSGLLHYQASPSLLSYTMSQEMRKVGVDVVWQWNSPKRNPNLDRPPNGHHHQDQLAPCARKRRKSFNCHNSQSSSSTGGTATDKATGFYKIREELLRAKKEDSLFMRLLQTEEGDSDVLMAVPPEENVKETGESTRQSEEAAKTKADDSSKEATTLTRKLSDEFLNDSDNDENLLIVSQETEMKMEQEQQQQQLQMQLNRSCNNKRTATGALQSREMSFTNDSFDQYLIDIPFDELLNRNARNLDETLVSGGSGVKKGKNALNRTQSMPPDTGMGGDQKSQQQQQKQNSINSNNNHNSNKGGCLSNNNVSTSSSRTMARHESMPTSSRGSSSSSSSVNSGRISGDSDCGLVGSGATVTSKFSVSNPTLASAAGLPLMSSSSTESLYSAASSSTEKGHVVCSQSEIARKRQIARERLKLKQKQQQHHQLPSINKKQ